MILIDSIYINAGGGLHLLKYLTRVLQERNIDFFLLADSRCNGVFDNIEHVAYIPASIVKRIRFYIKHQHDFSKVFCFGNVPPPIRMPVSVFTYFHNINLLNLTGCISRKRRILAFAKRSFIHFLKRKTDKWIVQTTNTKTELMHYFNENSDKIFIMPFYDIGVNDVCYNKYNVERNDYVLIGSYNYGNRGHVELIEAIKLLCERGKKITLHITCDESDINFLKIKEKYDFHSIGIVNHGIVKFEEVKKMYLMSKALIYPSRNESLGLGLIEAISYGCDILSSDLPFTYSVCKPSGVFNPYDPVSIADAIEKYEMGGAPKSKLIIKNQIENIVSLF